MTRVVVLLLHPSDTFCSLPCGLTLAINHHYTPISLNSIWHSEGSCLFHRSVASTSVWPMIFHQDIYGDYFPCSITQRDASAATKYQYGSLLETIEAIWRVDPLRERKECRISVLWQSDWVSLTYVQRDQTFLSTLA
ncbi:hypothetical protein CPB85DRAFT_981859 [Mucidula mucida]|nr:hypothetical protein CPB85DRAFT_981859 [Mucidula mucida]